MLPLPTYKKWNDDDYNVAKADKRTEMTEANNLEVLMHSSSRERGKQILEK